MPTSGVPVTGITVLGCDVFVVRLTSKVSIYSSTNFTSSQKLKIRATGAKHLQGIDSCSHNNCLYVIDNKQDAIYRHDLSNNVTTKWSVSGTCCGLSVNKCYNVLATLFDTKRVLEYTTHGSLIREISLNIDGPLHCVQLSTGNFVVSHYGDQHRVCYVDKSGRIIQSYGGSRGSGVGQLNNPYHIAIDIRYS